MKKANKLLQQNVTVVRLTISSNQTEKMKNTISNYTNEGMDWHQIFSFDNMTQHVKMSFQKLLTTEHVNYVYNKCKSEV